LTDAFAYYDRIRYCPRDIYFKSYITCKRFVELCIIMSYYIRIDRYIIIICLNILLIISNCKKKKKKRCIYYSIILFLIIGIRLINKFKPYRYVVSKFNLVLIKVCNIMINNMTYRVTHIILVCLKYLTSYF